jgi:hypothetical protein
MPNLAGDHSIEYKDVKINIILLSTEHTKIINYEQNGPTQNQCHPKISWQKNVDFSANNTQVKITLKNGEALILLG